MIKERKSLLLLDKRMAVEISSLHVLTLEDLAEKACALFFPNGKNSFASHLEEMNTWICDTTEVAIF